MKAAFTNQDRLEAILSRLKGAHRYNGYWMALCPAHNDKNPSLKVQPGEDGRILIHCFAGCKPERILSAIGLDWDVLYPPDRRLWAFLFFDPLKKETMATLTKSPQKRGALRRGEGVRLCVRLSTEEAHALHEEARRRRASLSEVVRWAIYQAIPLTKTEGAL
jgi:hypothetical protein